MNYTSVSHPSRCVSSHLMDMLLTWRNPHGDEINWYYGNPNDDDNGRPYNENAFFARRIVTELSLPILALASVIETVAYLTFGILIALPSLPITWSDYWITLADSAYFTFGWALTNLFNNFIYTNLSTKESFAMINWYGGTNDARHYHTEWLLTNRPYLFSDDVQKIERDPDRRKTKAGAKFLIEEVYKKCLDDPEFIEAFGCLDTELYHFLLVKSFAVYVSGTQKDKSLPIFFKPSTNQELESIRDRYFDQTADHDELLKATASWKIFEEASPKKDTLFYDLMQVALNEKKSYTGFLYISDCWTEALKNPLFLQPQEIPGLFSSVGKFNINCCLIQG